MNLMKCKFCPQQLPLIVGGYECRTCMVNYYKYSDTIYLQRYSLEEGQIDMFTEECRTYIYSNLPMIELDYVNLDLHPNQAKAFIERVIKLKAFL